ncbi:SH2 domain containing 5 [Cichlidogyrus casuarinus]|uniref:SH2 domain containing 5 n=1 Tax=Cichlidogyrus casuarinus TaxID=1844966 RepID=A0ABD2PYR6_9PLAT
MSNEGNSTYDERLSSFPESMKKVAQYIGSFHVSGSDHRLRAESVRKQLEAARDNFIQSKPIMLIISLNGIKVCSADGNELYMAHALRRISYATCDPEYRQFAFLAREPRHQPSSQYCHAFVTSSSPEAEELNAILGEAFRLAYYLQQQQQDSLLQTTNTDAPNGAKVANFSPKKSLDRPASDKHPEPDSTNSENLSPASSSFYNVANSNNKDSKQTLCNDSLRSTNEASKKRDSSPVYSIPPEEYSNPLICSQEAQELEQSLWFQPNFTREQALSFLSEQRTGGFVVRESKSHANCYALSIRVPIDACSTTGRRILGGDAIQGNSTDPYSHFRVVHFLIQRSASGVKLKGVDKQWPGLPNMILHLTVLQENLPHPLVLPETSPLNDINPSFEEPHSPKKQPQDVAQVSLIHSPNQKDYRCLHDLNGLMTELNIQQARIGAITIKESAH